MTKTMQGSEDQEQQSLFQWAAVCSKAYPDLEFMFHIPNGGRRDKKTGAALKRMGVKAGVPDICLPAPRGGYHGLYIEMKVGKNKPSKNQSKFLNYLCSQGYAVAVCYGWDTAQGVILDYLNEEG